MRGPGFVRSEEELILVDLVVAEVVYVLESVYESGASGWPSSCER
jgi:hypothetical protein